MSFSRQIELLDPKEILWPATIIGLGTVGSAAARTLAKMGFKELTVYDPDAVGEENLSCQTTYRGKDVGTLKAIALKDAIEEQAPWCKVEAIPEAFTGQHKLKGIVVAAVDHMEKNEQGWYGRKDIWEKAERNLDVVLLLDCRLDQELVDLYTVKPHSLSDIERYRNSLYPDSKATSISCGARGISYVSDIAAGFIGLQVKRWIKKEEHRFRITLGLKIMDLLIDGQPI